MTVHQVTRNVKINTTRTIFTSFACTRITCLPYKDGVLFRFYYIRVQFDCQTSNYPTCNLSVNPTVGNVLRCPVGLSLLGRGSPFLVIVYTFNVYSDRLQNRFIVVDNII